MVEEKHLQQKCGGINPNLPADAKIICSPASYNWSKSAWRCYISQQNRELAIEHASHSTMHFSTNDLENILHAFNNSVGNVAYASKSFRTIAMSNKKALAFMHRPTQDTIKLTQNYLLSIYVKLTGRHPR